MVLSDKGTLTCEVCGFEYSEKYGDLGRGFAECHHTKPLGELSKKTKTMLEDLSIICANCHRMIHRTNPLMTIKELAEYIEHIS
jgi:5-methylcytosine-specific restriction protein A